MQVRALKEAAALRQRALRFQPPVLSGNGGAASAGLGGGLDGGGLMGEEAVRAECETLAQAAGG